MKKMYNRGDSMLPCGTPASNVNCLERKSFTLIWPCLLQRKLEIHFVYSIGIPTSCNILRKASCHAVSKALAASINMDTVLPVGLLLNHFVMCSASLST